MLRALHLPAAPGLSVDAPTYEVRDHPRVRPEEGRSRPDPGRQRLLAERAMLQLAWIGLLAVREGFTCPADAPACGVMPPERSPETIEAQIVPEVEDRAISAYQKASALAGPKAVRRVDTHA